MSLIIPQSLFNLPAPWNNLSDDPRDSVEPCAEQFRVAFDVLDRCLQAAAVLPDHTIQKVMPDFILMGWSLWASGFAIEMSTFEEFSIQPIKKAFRKQDPDISEDVIIKYAQTWLRKQALQLAKRARYWLESHLKNSDDQYFSNIFFSLTEYYVRVSPILGSTLLGSLWTINEVQLKPLLERIVKDSGSPPILIERAKRLLDASG